MLSLRAFTLNLYRPPAPLVRSAVCLKTRDSGLRHRALEQPADHYRRARWLIRRYSAPSRARAAVECSLLRSHQERPYRMRQDRERWRQVSNSPAIPLPIPLPEAPVKPCQLIDIHEINDIESALFGCRRRFSLVSGRNALEPAIRPACNPNGA